MKTVFCWSSHPRGNEELAAWAAKRIFTNGGSFGQPFSTMGVLDDGRVVGVVVFHNYSREHGVIEMSAAADTPRWLTRPVLKDMFSFAFRRLECQMVTLRVDPSDTRLARILTAYGFDALRIPRMRGRDRDEILFTLTDDAWKANGFHKELCNG